LQTITGNHEKLIIPTDFVRRHFRECSDNLLLRREVGALLELEVTDSSAQRKVAIDSAKVDETASCVYPCLLTLILWLVVERQGFGAALDAENRSRVAGVALPR